jgi:SanA protein
MVGLRRVVRRLTICGVAMVGLSATAASGGRLYVGLASRSHVVNDPRLIRPAEAAIVPGTSCQDGRPNPMLAGRLSAALTLFRQGRVARILISGNENAGEVSAMGRWLLEHGVPDANIVRDPRGTRTLETMRRAVTVFAIKSAVVCTQRVHQDRTLFLARASGMDAVGFEAPGDVQNVHARGAEILKSSLALFETVVLGRLSHDSDALALRVAVK